jgi:hypothetical protein
MARKRRPGTIASTRITDDELTGNIEEIAPELFDTVIKVDDFIHVIDRLLGQEMPEPMHFYCRPCGEYHLKTHPHHAEMKKRKAARKN